jgi:hypothetical protein
MGVVEPGSGGVRLVGKSERIPDAELSEIAQEVSNELYRG